MACAIRRAIGKVIVDPNNPDIAFVAALGHPYGPNSERGIFRTTDGGKTWDKVLYKDENTGGIDVAFDPHNPNILFASLWEVRRTPWTLVSGGPGSGLYRSDDGGTTWKRLEEHGLPKGPYGRIGVAVAANSDRVYALIEAHEGGLYRSDDGGETWELVNGDRSYQQRAWYYMHVIADPQDARHRLRRRTSISTSPATADAPSTRSRFRTATITVCGLILRIRGA